MPKALAEETHQTGLSRVATAIRRLLDPILPDPVLAAERRALALKRAVAGLLMEMARMNFEVKDERLGMAARLLRRGLDLSEAETEALVAEAAKKSGRYTSYYEPVQAINRGCSAEQKVNLIEQLWRVAYADGEVDMYEEHLVRKIAELLYVPHVDFITAKHRAQAASENERACAES